jgi:RNA-binding protein Musashi
MRNYFQQFGTVTDAFVMYDPRTQSPRGFGFIVYDSENAVDFVVQNPFHQLNGKMVEVKRAFRKVFSGGPIRLPAGTGREGNFGASNVHGFNSTPVPPMNTGYGYSSYGPTGYNTPSYGTGAGYGPGFTGGGYDNTTFMNNNPSYGTGSYVGAPVSYGGPVVYGVSNAGNGGLYGNNATHTPGSNMWGAPAMAYGNTDSSVGHGSSGSGGISQYGVAQVDNEQSNGSGAGYAAQNSGYEMGVTRYS